MPPEPVEHEATLLRACLDGEPGAFDRLIERYRGLVHHAVRAALARTGAARDEELFDEAVVRVYTTLAENDMKVLRSFQGRSRLGTFVTVVARRVALRTACAILAVRAGRAENWMPPFSTLGQEIFSS